VSDIGLVDMSLFAGPRSRSRGAVVGDRDCELVVAGIVSHTVATPLMAAVDGAALGGGADIALTCDLIVASVSSRFGFPKVRLGIFAELRALHASALGDVIQS
jgi:enoyl-CoA hydratase/carnithine racemase